jgi:hypothetical protein
MIARLLVIFILLFPPFLSAADLVVSGNPVSVIVVDASAPGMVTRAASLFQKYVQDMTGATLPIQNTPSETQFNVFIGASSYTDALGVTSAGTHDGGFKIATGGDYLVLLGDDRMDARPQTISGAAWDAMTAPDYFRNPTPYPTNPNRDCDATYQICETDGRGTMNAVHEFFYDRGFRWYYPSADGTIIPNSHNLSFPATNRTVNPDFSLRHPYLYHKRFSSLSSSSYPGGNLEGSRDEWFNWQFSLRANSYFEKYAGKFPHGVGGVLDREENKTAFPEYYAVWGGVRQVEDPKANLCSPELLSATIRYAKKVFDLNPNHIVDIAPSDGFTQASEEPAGCKDKETPERGYDGTLSDYVWDFQNNVAWAIHDDPAYGPDRLIMGMAYTTYKLPPLALSDVRGWAPNLVVLMATKWRGVNTNPEAEAYQQNLMQQWIDILPSKKIYNYDYYLFNRVGNATESLPLFYPKAIARDLAFLKGKSDGEYIEIFTNWFGWNLTYDTFAAEALNTYVTYRLYWDADQDVDALLNEYYDLYYGPAGLKMKELHEYSENNHAIRLNPVFLQTIRTLANEARVLTGEGTAYRNRVDRLLGLMNAFYLGEEFEINSCQTLASAGTTYLLTQDVTAPSACFPIDQNGITLDCQGHTITFGTEGAGNAIAVNARQSDRGDYLTVRNCVITSPSASPSSAIQLSSAKYITIENNSINTARTGISASGVRGQDHIYRNNEINAGNYGVNLSVTRPLLENNVLRSDTSAGAYINSSEDAIVRNNTLTSGCVGSLCNGLRLRNVTGADVTGNFIASVGTSPTRITESTGIQLSGNTIVNNWVPPPQVLQLFGLLPASGSQLARSINRAQLRVETTSPATCRWSHRPNVDWNDMTEYASTGQLVHSGTLPVVSGGVYRVCNRCYDSASLEYSYDSCTNFSVEVNPKFMVW